MKTITLLVAAAAAMTFAGQGFAGPRGAADMQHGFLPGRIARQLDLAPEQEQAIQDIMSTAKPRFQALRENARTTRLALMEANPDDPGYATVVAEASQASASHAAALVNLAAEVKAEVYAVLTVEQKQRATEMMAEMQERRARFMEDGPRQHRRWRRGPLDREVDDNGVDAG